MLAEKCEEVAAQAAAVAQSIEASPTEVPNTLLLEALERKCKELETACGNG